MKFPPSEKPASVIGRPVNFVASARTAPTTSGRRQEWNSSRFR
jgi:hypothetical protein